MKSLRQVLPGALGREEVLRAARAQRVLREWSQVVGPDLARRSCPDRYEKGVAWVAVQGSAWAQELRMLKPRILQSLQERAGEPGLFVDVRFGTRPLPPAAPAQAAPPPAPQIDERDSLTIREIKERRLALLKEEPDAPRGCP